MNANIVKNQVFFYRSLNINFTKVYKNASIMKTNFLHKIKYDLKGHGRSHKAFLAKFFIAHHLSNSYGQLLYLFTAYLSEGLSIAGT